MPPMIGRVIFAAAAIGAGALSQAHQLPSPAGSTFRESRAITGLVMDSDGQPVEGARIALVPIGLLDLSGARFASVSSGADGRFIIPAPAHGRIALTATFNGHVAARAGDVVNDGPIQLQLGRVGRELSGRIFNHLGRPQANAEVRLALGLGGSGDIFLIRSDEVGHWRASVPCGDYLIHAVAPGQESAPRVLEQGMDVADLVLKPRSSVPPPPVVMEWLRTSAIPLATVEPGRGNADLAPIGHVIGDARVVGLGEVTHGTREVFKLKHRLVEYLVGELDFTVFAIEFGLSESFAIDDYVMGRGGEPEALLAAQSAAVWQAEELLDLIRWMRDWNRSHERKIRFHGLDMRTGASSAQQLLAYLHLVDEVVLSSPAAQALVPLTDPATYRNALRISRTELATLASHARALTRKIEDHRVQYIAKSRHDDWWRAATHSRALAQMLEWRAAPSPLARVQIRERAMADNAMQLLKHYGPDARTIIWAHNAHVFADADAEPQMTGVHLRRRIGANYRSFGTLLYRGSYQAGGESGRLSQYSIPSAPPGSIEEALAATSLSIAALDLRGLRAPGAVADWFEPLRVMRQFDGLYEDKRPEGWADPVQAVTRNYDALLFIEDGTSARAMPAAKFDSH